MSVGFDGQSESTSKAEVSYFDMMLGVDQDVLGLDVSVDHSFQVTMFQSS